jgi:HSP20 family protein
MTLAPFSSRQRRGSGLPAAAPAFRWNPYREMDEINNRFSQLIQTFFGDTSGVTGGSSWSPLAPPVDIEETDDAYVVDIDLPNVNPEDVTIEMRGEELRILGRFQQRERTGIVRRQNRPAGEFEYTVDLPSDIDANRVEATYDGGVLRVTVDKAPDAHPRRIEIRGAREQRELGQGDQPQAGQRDDQREAAQATQEDRQRA